MANIIVKPTQILGGGGQNEFKFLAEDIMMSDKSTTVENKFKSYYTKSEVDSISQYLSSSITNNANLFQHYHRLNIIDDLNISQKTNLYLIDLTNQYGDNNKRAFFSNPVGDRPLPGVNPFIGVWECFWFTKDHVGVHLIEFYPYNGREWFAFYNVGTWAPFVAKEPLHSVSEDLFNYLGEKVVSIYPNGEVQSKIHKVGNIVIINAYLAVQSSDGIGIINIAYLPPAYRPHRVVPILIHIESSGETYPGGIDGNGRIYSDRTIPSGGMSSINRFRLNISYTIT